MQTITHRKALPHKQCSVNTTRETLARQCLPSPSETRKVQESHVAFDVTDRGEISRKKLGSESSTQAMYSRHAQ